MARKGGKDKGILEWPPKSGKWFARLYINGQERRYRCGTKSEAKALYCRLKADQLSDRYFEKPKVVPFREVAEDYLARVDARRRRKGDDQSRMNRWIQALGNLNVCKISPRHIEQVLTAMTLDGYAPATVLRHLAVLKATLNDAKRLGLLQENPACRVKPPKVNNVLLRYLTPEQEARLYDHLSQKYHSIVKVALNTGCRQGELLRLRWKEVDWNIGVMTIHETKSGDSRSVPLNSEVQSVLVAIHDQTCPDPHDRIFSFDDRYLRRAFDKAVKAAGLDPFRFHDLRHTFASRLAMQGCNDRTLMALGGWKSPRMLSRYAHLTPAHLWQAVEGLVGNSSGGQTRTVTKTVNSVEGERAVVQNPLKNWSGKGDLNPRPSPWQGDALPLSYSRSLAMEGDSDSSGTSMGCQAI